VEVENPGFGLAVNELHAFVVHEEDGGRIACGILKYQDDVYDGDHLTAVFGPYPESDAKGVSSVGPESQVWITPVARGGGYHVHYFLTGLAASETSGGIHVHTGTSCDTHEEIMGHYYATAEDPWTTVWTKAAGATVAAGAVYVADPGFGLAVNDGHAFVVHEEDGKRIACGVLSMHEGAGADSADSLAAHHLTVTFGPYPESAAKGEASVGAGSQVWITENESGSYTVHYHLTDLPAAETSGGIHVHTGMSCATHEQVLGHYYVTAEDPWTTNWMKAAGETSAMGSVEVENPGFGLAVNELHAFVVHEEDGGRIACGILNYPLPAM